MILLLSDDLMDASKTTANGRAAGVQVLQCRTMADLVKKLERGDVTCCVLDLQHAELKIEELLKAVGERPPRPRVVAYGSHVDAARLNAARKAGCHEVMPRSSYFEKMPGAIAGWNAVRSEPEA